MMWEYHYKAYDQSELQDFPSAMEITEDGQFLVVGSWGDSGAEGPTVNVFGRHLPDGPLFAANTPGSVRAVDIVQHDRTKELLVVAAGKLVHANKLGDGGDLYSFLIPIQPDPSFRGRPLADARQHGNGTRAEA